MLTAVILFVLGLIFGSFVNALVWRLHNKKGIVRERSQCVHCGHTLAAKDLVPILSWITLKGRCRYCGRPISLQYPIVELTMALVFVASYYFWPADLQGGQGILLKTWLAVSVGLLALLVYDLRYMLLPSKILYPTAALAIVGRAAYIAGYGADKPRAILAWLASVGVASGIFWLIYELSRGKAIGFGDVRLGLISGTVLADPLLALQMIFVASLLGTLAILPSLIVRHKSLQTKVPYGPFLIAATFIVLLFGPNFTDWYSRVVLLH